MGRRKPAPAPSGRTPGPWQYRAGMSGVQIVSPDGIVVARTPCLDRQSMADGALLAAAPGLLTAAKNLARCLQAQCFESDDLCDLDQDECLTALDAAIAQAEVAP